MATYDVTKIALPSGDIVNLKDANATKTEASTTNGNIKIDNVETPVYRNYANNTVLTTDKSPYLNRQCLNPTGFSSYVREKLIGCSVAWNQLVDKTNLIASTTISQIQITNNNDGSLTFNGTAPSTYAAGVIVSSIANPIPANHVFAILGGSSKITLYDGSSGVTQIYKKNVSFGWIYFYIAGGVSVNEKIYPQLIDLTLAFGSSVADTLYAMTNNGGIDWLRNHNYPIDQYTQYGYGLYSSKPSAKKVVGFNVWDEEWEVGGINVSSGANETDNRIRSKNPIPVLPNTAYYVKDAAWVLEYDVNGNYLGIYVGGNTVFATSANTRYLKFKSGSGITTYANNITVNISDTNKNGQYEPYSATTYSLGSTELRGHLIVQNGEIVAEGDVRESNGNVTRNYGIVDLGSLTWTYHTSGNMYTDNVVSDRATGSQTKVIAICERYVQCIGEISGVAGLTTDKAFAFQDTMIGRIIIRDTAYTNATSFKTAMSGVYLVYELATPTTETSSPFADPMSLNGCTTEEYVDDRTIPVPVGHETQYMGQSEDVVEIPSSPQSDGKRKLIAETSGGKTQYYWEGEISDKPKRTTIINLAAYSSSLNRFEVPCDGYIMAWIEPGEGAFSMNLSDYYEELLDFKVVYSPEHNTYFSFYVKKGMKYYYANSQGLTVSIAFRGIT